VLTLGGIIFLIVVGLGVVAWQANARARELATRISKQMCERHDMQFLDGTTILDRFRIKRGDNGRLGFVRHYHFDFYNGIERLKGRVTIFKNEVTELFLENPLPDLEPPKQRDLFRPANEVSNVIEFPGKKKQDNSSED
jgi:hypothetical protein